MNERGGFSPDEWRTLQFVPLWMFAFEAFSRSVRSAAAAPGRLNREVTTSVAADRPTIGSGLCEMAAIPGRVGPEEAELLKTALISAIGEGVARGRGRSGRVVSEEDAKNLQMIAQFHA